MILSSFRHKKSPYFKDLYFNGGSEGGYLGKTIKNQILKRNLKAIFGVFLDGVPVMNGGDDLPLFPAFISVIKDRNFHLVSHLCVSLLQKD